MSGAIFRALEGRWSLTREMTHFGKNDAFFKGTAFFKRFGDGNGYRYREEGVLESRNFKNRAFREYLYEYKDDKISVFFTDVPKRLFHTLVFDKEFKSATAHHFCVADIYQARYEFLNENAFKLSYQIEGPSKKALYVTYFVKEIEDKSNFMKTRKRC